MSDSANVDALIRSLDQSMTVDRRLYVLDHLVAYWHGTCRNKDGYSEEVSLSGFLIQV
jgi:hypothetical protein